MSGSSAKKLRQKAKKFADPKLERMIYKDIPFVKYAARSFIAVCRILKKQKGES